VTTYGIEALRQLREQQAIGLNLPPAQEWFQSEADNITREGIGIDDEVGGADDDFEAMYEAWIDFGMESGG
jgi:hypothetical protein